MEFVVRIIISGNRKTASVVVDTSIFLRSYPKESVPVTNGKIREVSKLLFLLVFVSKNRKQIRPDKLLSLY